MTKEPITSRVEIERQLARLVSCTLKAHALTSKAAAVEIETASHIIVNTDRRLRVGKTVWLEFVGSQRLRYGFEAKVLEAIPDGARISYPSTIYRINRRSYCRVETAPGSLATFNWQGRAIRAEMMNISAGGAAFWAEPFTEAVGVRLKDIELSLPAPDGALEQLTVPAAVIRHMRPGPEGKTLYGVAFRGLGKMVEALMHYVRGRERQILRKKREGLAA